MELSTDISATEASRKPLAVPGRDGVDMALVSPVPGSGPAASDIQAVALPRPWFPVFGLHVPLPAAMRALRHRNFRLFWSGQLISLVGTWMQNIARGWLVLELTRSPFWLGMVGFANSLPVLLLSLWAGAIADRVPKRLLVIVTQSISMVLAFVLAYLTWTNTVQVSHLIVISLILGTTFAFDAPTRQAFTVEMVGGKEDLMNAVALNSSIFNGARVLGPAIGAVALAWQGPALAFFLNGLSYIAVIIGLLMMRLPDERKKLESRSGGQIMEGLRFVRRNAVIGPLMIIVAVVSVFAFPYAILMPIFADSILKVGEGGYGMLMAFSGIGSLIGAVSLAFQSGRAEIKRGRLIVIGSLGLPIALSIFALSSNYIVSLVTLIAVGWTMISINATINTVVQTNVPDELRGRVNGVFAFLFIGMAPLGNLQAGLIADHFGAPIAILSGAIICGVISVYLLLRHRHILSLS